MILFNTLTQNKQNLKTIKNNKVSIYVCGITPYDTTHLGHAFTYISFDALIRYLKYKGYEVNYTQNVTDINDRDNDILKRAKEQNIAWDKLSDFWTNKFLLDMKNLNWTMPTTFLFASKNISEITGLISKLITNGKAYLINGSVYLDVGKINDFGKLSKFDKKKMLKIARDFEEDTENPDKKNKLDITLWRVSANNNPSHIPVFESTFGKGRTGWYIECSAMAISSLGGQIDIHGGGKDLIYPHHEAEIAQSEGATGKIPFAQLWMHTGQVAYRGEKMSKSLGNLIMISDLLKTYSPNVIRWLLLSNYYRNDWEFTDDLIISAEMQVNGIETYLNSKAKGLTDFTDRLGLFMENDFDTPSVLSFINKNLNKLSTQKLQEFLNILGFKF